MRNTTILQAWQWQQQYSTYVISQHVFQRPTGLFTDMMRQVRFSNRWTFVSSSSSSSSSSTSTSTTKTIIPAACWKKQISTNINPLQLTLPQLDRQEPTNRVKFYRSKHKYTNVIQLKEINLNLLITKSMLALTEGGRAVHRLILLTFNPLHNLQTRLKYFYLNNVQNFEYVVFIFVSLISFLASIV